ncbi:hypothetical protein [Bacillus sp. T3]|uniref:hypothetical protein n=1 Tax=Bacillus sp. T3 TaxID=467262 RepID=UPI002980CE50|nr:hypothetical protein [Bacillus sp. T3]
MQNQDSIQLSLFDSHSEEFDQMNSIDELFSQKDLICSEKVNGSSQNEILELNGFDKEEVQSSQEEIETITEFDGISSVEELFSRYIFGTGIENKSAWSRKLSE